MGVSAGYGVNASAPSPVRPESVWSNPLPQIESWVLTGDSGRIEERNLVVLCAGKPKRAAKVLAVGEHPGLS